MHNRSPLDQTQTEAFDRAGAGYGAWRLYGSWCVSAGHRYGQSWADVTALRWYHQWAIQADLRSFIRTQGGCGRAWLRSGESVILVPGTIFSARFRDLSSIVSEGDGGWQFHWVDAIGALPKGVSALVHRQVAPDAIEALDLRAMHEDLNHPDPMRRGSAAARLEAIILRWLCCPIATSRLPPLQERILAVGLERVAEEVRVDPGRLWTVPEMARRADMPMMQFRAVFQQTYAVSPRRYLLERRMERAATMLQTQDLPIAFMARRLGYRHAAHFTRAFKSFHGMTPVAFRAQAGTGPR